MRKNELNATSRENLWAEVNWQNEGKLANCRDREIKDDAELWRHARISPADFETANLAGSKSRRKNIGGLCRFLKPAAQQLGHFSAVALSKPFSIKTCTDL